jgi:ATP-binding protein involved in chromosome partitioning
VEHLDQLSEIVNPETGKSFTDEKRWLSINSAENKVTVTYNRDGIETKYKREIEESIVKSLSGNFDEDNIYVKTVSESSTPRSSTVATADNEKVNEDAKLSVGHGANTGKKRIPGVSNVIAVSSCKGGVGKSTLTVNLAASLTKLGKTVGIIDADIYGPSLPILLGQKGAKPQATENKKIKPLVSNGMKFISFGLFIGEEDPVIWRGPMLGGVLNQFFFDTDWGELDYLLIDLPPGTGDTQLSMVQNTEVDAVVVISTPQDVAVADTRKGIKMFEQVNIPVLGLVENMSYFCPPDDQEKKYYIFGEGGVKEAAKNMNLEFLGEVPLSIALRESADNGLPYVANIENEGSTVYNSYLNLASKINKMRTKDEKGFFNKLFNK